LVTEFLSVAYFPRLVSLKSQLLQTILDFFETKCKPALQSKFTEYIIDFGITGNLLDKVWVIELNEFMDTTDGCMFNWAQERHILENGPLQFRIQECLDEEKQNAFLGPEWRALLNEEFH